MDHKNYSAEAYKTAYLREKATRQEVEKILDLHNDDLKHVTDKIVQQENFTSSILNSIPDGLLICDLDGSVEHINQEAQRIFNLDEREILGSSLMDHFDDRHKDLLIDQLYELYSNKNPIKNFASHIIRDKIKSVPVSISLSVNNQKADDIEKVIIIIKDMTEFNQLRERDKSNFKQLEKAYEQLKEMQGQLIQKEKLATLGTLSAGIAHEINNPIGFVYSNIGSLTGYLQYYNRLLKQYEKLFKHLEKNQHDKIDNALSRIRALRKEDNLKFIEKDSGIIIDQTCEGIIRVKNIIESLRVFSRQDPNDFEESNINEGIISTMTILQSQLKYRSKVIKELGDLPLIHCNLNQLNQVFLNLLVNAIQATDENGEIQVTSYHDHINIYIEFKDNGSGISENQLSRIFDPFYTSKPINEGTGLGLSISLKIIQLHGGTIEVKSEKNKGSVFTITLPIQHIKEFT